MKKLLFLGLLCGIQTFAQAPAQQFIRTYGGTRADEARAIDQTSDGGYIIAGNTKSDDGLFNNHYGNPGLPDLFAIKVTPGGVVQWKVWLGGTEDDSAMSVKQTTDGGYIIAGYTRSTDNDVLDNHAAGYYDMWVIKLNSNGGVTWKKCFGGTGDEKAYDVIQTADGGYMVCASAVTNSPPVGRYGGVIKLDASGNLLWSKSFLDNSDFKAVHQLSDGSYVAAGTRTDDFYIVKMNSAGTATAIATYGGSNQDICNSMTPTSDGGYILAGTTTSTDGDVTGFQGGTYDYWVVKVDANLNLVWQKTLGGSGYDQANGVRELENGYIIAGTTNSTDGNVTTPLGNGDTWVVKLDTSGNLLWQGSYGTATENEQAFAMDITTDLGIALVGRNGGGTLDTDAILIKIEGSCPMPPFVDPQIVCVNSTVSTLTAQGQNLKWYTTQTGGTALAPTTVVTNGTYYVSQTVNGCESTRTQVVINVTTLAAPAVGTQQNICGPATIANLGAVGVDGAVIKWYNSASSTTPLSSTLPLTSGNYYATQSLGTCESPRSMVNVFVTNVYAPVVISPYNYCNSPDEPLTVSILNAQDVAVGINRRWFTQPTGGTSLPQTTVIASGTYYVSQTINSCISPRSEVIINSNLIDNMVVQYADNSLHVLNPTSAVNYSWINCTTNAVVGTGLNFMPTVSGSYGFVASPASGGCSVNSPCANVNLLADENFTEQNSLTIHPNPVQDVLTLGTHQEILETKIYDLMGRLTQQDTSAKTLNVQQLSNGVYLLEVKTASGTLKQKFVKN